MPKQQRIIIFVGLFDNEEALFNYVSDDYIDEFEPITSQFESNLIMSQESYLDEDFIESQYFEYPKLFIDAIVGHSYYLDILKHFDNVNEKFNSLIIIYDDVDIKGLKSTKISLVFNKVIEVNEQ